MTERDYTSFARLAGRLFRPTFAALGFERVTDILYSRTVDSVVQLIGLQITRFGGDTFYVNYGASVRGLGSPWYPDVPLKDEGLLVHNRLQTPDRGQGYDCSSKAALTAAVAQVEADLKTMAVPWFRDHTTVDQIALAYYDQWDLRPVGSNESIKRLGVRHYGFLQLLLDRRERAQAWLREARDLESDPMDEQDRRLLERILADISGR